jgi:hypothetical protein
MSFAEASTMARQVEVILVGIVATQHDGKSAEDDFEV